MNMTSNCERVPVRASVSADPLPRPLRTALNRRAHAEGLAHAELVKRRLTAELEALRDGGATYAELCQHLERKGG